MKYIKKSISVLLLVSGFSSASPKEEIDSWIERANMTVSVEDENLSIKQHGDQFLLLKVNTTMSPLPQVLFLVNKVESPIDHVNGPININKDFFYEMTKLGQSNTLQVGNIFIDGNGEVIKYYEDHGERFSQNGNIVYIHRNNTPFKEVN